MDALQRTARSRDGWMEEKTLGSGGFGTVTMWRNEESGQSIALKRIRLHNEMSPNVKQRWEMECRIMQRLDHDNVIKAFPVPPALDQRDSDMPLLAMEYCESGDLRKVLTKPENSCGLGEFQVRTIVKHIASAIEYLHSMKIIHRDLKPENVVITQVDEKRVYKLIDLGYAKDLEQGSVCTSFVGTMQYLAPELFQSQRYTQTVDFWSFGILMFECCAGFRPFLHHMPPVSWQSIVCKKSKDDIYAYSDENNKVVFSRFIPSPNYLSRTTQLYMEHWLRMMLAWDPKERGGPLTNANDPSKPSRVSCFEILSKILETRLMHVFVVHMNVLISYPLHGPETKVGDVMDVITKEVKIPVEDQELLLASGALVDENAPAFQYVTDEPNEEMSDWIVFLFNKRENSYPAPDRTTRSLPTHASAIVSQPKELSSWNDQRQTWSHSLYFCRQVSRDYKILLDSQRAAMLSLLRYNSNFTKLKTQLSSDVSSLQSKIDFFNKCHDFDLTKYQDQASYGISSDKMFANWTEMDTQVRKFARLKQEVKNMEQQAASINLKVMELNRSPFAKTPQDNSLKDTADEALKLCTELRNKPYEKRSKKTDNLPMVQCILNCLHKRSKLTDDIYSFLERVMSCRAEVITLLPRVQEMCETVKEASRRLVTYQLQRQKDMWQLVSASIKQSKILQEKLTKQQKQNEQLHQQMQHLKTSETMNGEGIINLRRDSTTIQGDSGNYALSRSSSSHGGVQLNLGSMPSANTGNNSANSGSQSLGTASGLFLDKNSQMSLFSMQNNEKLRKELSTALQGLPAGPSTSDESLCDWEFLLQKRTHTC